MASASDLAQALLANNADVSPLGGLTKFAAELLRRSGNTSIGQSMMSAYTAPARAIQGEFNPSLGVDDSGNYVDLNANKSAQEGLNFAGNMLADSLPLAPSGAGTVGTIKNGTINNISWPEWQKTVNSDYSDYINFVRKKVLNESNKLVDLLSNKGINATSTGIGNDIPSTYTNGIGGVSSYLSVPGYGEVRFSDHMRSSGMGNDHTFGSADDAFYAIKDKYSNTLQKNIEIDNLRKQLGIVNNDDKTNMKIIQDWLLSNPQEGSRKDVGTWKSLLNLSQQSGNWEPTPLNLNNYFDK